MEISSLQVVPASRLSRARTLLLPKVATTVPSTPTTTLGKRSPLNTWINSIPASPR